MSNAFGPRSEAGHMKISKGESQPQVAAAAFYFILFFTMFWVDHFNMRRWAHWAFFPRVRQVPADFDAAAIDALLSASQAARGSLGSLGRAGCVRFGRGGSRERAQKLRKLKAMRTQAEREREREEHLMQEPEPQPALLAAWQKGDGEMVRCESSGGPKPRGPSHFMV